MKKLSFLTILLMAFFWGYGQSYDIDLGAPKNIKELTKNDLKSIEATYAFSGISSFNVKTERGQFSEIAIPGTHSIGNIGEPKLPAAKDLIMIPFGAEVAVEVVSYNKTTYQLTSHGIEHKLMPVQPSISKSQDPQDIIFEYNESVYNATSYIRPELASVEVLGVMRGIRIARLVIAPVAYNPDTDEIEVYNDVKIKINFTQTDRALTESKRIGTFSPYFEPVYKEMLNYRSVTDDYPDHPDLTTYPIKYLVVSDRMFEATLQPFLEWKTKQGFILEVAYTDEIGTSYSEVQSWVHDQYNNGDIVPSFLLLVGDIGQVPMQIASSSGKYTDLYYGSVDGDMFPEMYYGRFSAENVEDLQPQIDKTLYYEQYQFEDPSYLDRVTLIAGADATWNPNVGQPTVQYGTQNYFNAANGYATVNDYLTNYTGCYETIDEGIGFINYTAHCGQGSWASPYLSISDVNALVNENMYPLAVGNCCLSNDIGYSSECIGETWVRKANGGAVAYIGSAHYTYWFEDFYWAVGAFPIQGNNNGYVPSVEETTMGVYDAMFTGNYKTVDAKVFVGNLAVTEVDIQGYPQHSSPLYYWQAYMLDGDPSLMLYNTQGEENTVSHMEILPLGMETYEVTADPGSFVAISKDGLLHGAALVDESGVVNVPIEPVVSGGMVDIVVTGRQKIPYMVQVPAAALEGPYIVLDSTNIHDNTGNNNGLIDFGETVDLDVTLKNVGADDATVITATINGTDDYFTVAAPNSANFGTIAAGAVSTVAGAFTISVTDDVPDAYTVNFEMEMTDEYDSLWTSNLRLTANAPALAVGNITVDDAMYGNGNGSLDPGETADIVITAMNEGHADAPGTFAGITTTSDLLTITEGTYDVGLLEAGAAADAVFTVEVAPEAGTGDVVDINFNIASGNYEVSDEFILPIGLIIEDFESGNFDAFNWEFTGIADWIISNDAYEGFYSAASGTIGDNQQTGMSLTADVVTDGTISFYRKVSSESNFDYLRFYIDGTEKDAVSGNSDWTFVEFDVTEGTHTFEWSYEKDYSMSGGDDKGWVDFITFPPMEVPQAPLGVTINVFGTEICEGDSAYLVANATGVTGTPQYQWEPSASLSAPTGVATWAYPVETTTYSVTLTDGGQSVSDEVTITVLPRPEAPVIHEENNVLISSEPDGNQWCDHAGNYIPGATGQLFVPEHTDIYHDVIIGDNGCVSEPSNSIYVGFVPTDQVEEKVTEIYPNPFSKRTVITHAVESAASVRIAIYDGMGKLVRIVAKDSSMPAGTYTYEVDGRNMQEGVYYVVFETGDLQQTEKLVLVK
jgi:hypothetical protein